MQGLHDTLERQAGVVLRALCQLSQAAAQRPMPCRWLSWVGGLSTRQLDASRWPIESCKAAINAASHSIGSGWRSTEQCSCRLAVAPLALAGRLGLAGGGAAGCGRHHRGGGRHHRAHHRGSRDGRLSRHSRHGCGAGADDNGDGCGGCHGGAGRRCACCARCGPSRRLSRQDGAGAGAAAAAGGCWTGRGWGGSGGGDGDGDTHLLGGGGGSRLLGGRCQAGSGVSGCMGRLQKDGGAGVFKTARCRLQISWSTALQSDNRTLHSVATQCMQLPFSAWHPLQPRHAHPPAPAAAPADSRPRSVAAAPSRLPRS